MRPCSHSLSAAWLYAQRCSATVSLVSGSASRSTCESTPPLWNVLSAGRRPTEVCGNDTARAAEIFLHFSPSRSQTGWHWLESGAARQGQSMRIDRAVRFEAPSWKITRQPECAREGRGCSPNTSSSSQALSRTHKHPLAEIAYIYSAQ